MRYYEIVHRRNTQTATNRIARDESTPATQGDLAKRSDVYGCLVTLPRQATFRWYGQSPCARSSSWSQSVVSGSAQAQYAPLDPLNGSQYVTPAQDRSSTPMSQAMLDAHNAIRARVGVPPLVWSDQLAQVAQDWANHLIATGALSHRPNNRYGENIYAISGGHATPAEVVDLWAKEARGYDIRSNTCSGVCGHYTQIVWAKTRAVGCAVATDRGERSGCATTIRQETSSGSDRTEQPR